MLFLKLGERIICTDHVAAIRRFGDGRVQVVYKQPDAGGSRDDIWTGAEARAIWDHFVSQAADLFKPVKPRVHKGA
jgi:hypothetical protein